MYIGPEDPQALRRTGRHARPGSHSRGAWLCSSKGGGRASMQIKDIGASFLAMFPGNCGSAARLRRSLREAARNREPHQHQNAGQFRHLGAAGGAGKAAPPHVDPVAARSRGGATPKPRRSWGILWRASWARYQVWPWRRRPTPPSHLFGDALVHVALESHGLALGERERASFAVLTAASGHTIRPAAVSGPSSAMCSSHPPGSGKSVLANTINIGLCLSSAGHGQRRARSCR